MFQVSTRVRWLPMLATVALAALPAGEALAQRTPQTSSGLTVEKIFTRPGLTAPPLRGLEWSPDGKLLSYFHRSGSGSSTTTDLYAIDVAKPELPGSLLVSADKLKELLPPSTKKDAQSTGLGRVAPEEYQWAPSGKALLFSSADNLYWLDLDTGGAHRLLQVAAARSEKADKKAEIKDARISPDGRWVGFVRDHNLWMVEVASGRETQLTRGGTEPVRNAELDWVYPEELDLREAYWWSPDSARIAFLKMDERQVKQYPLVDSLSYTGEVDWMRYPKAGDPNPLARVGVIDVRSARPQGRQTVPVRWMDTGTGLNTYIARVNWRRDSATVAIQRLNRAQNRLDLIFADAATGKSRKILVEDDKYWVNLSDDLYFFADGKRFLWSSESDHVPGAQYPNPRGLRYLYLYGADGKLLKQLTHGDSLTIRVAGVDEKQGLVYFVGTEKNVRERHLDRVSVESGALDQVTREAGSHGARLSPVADAFVDSFSTTISPPQQRLVRLDGSNGKSSEAAPFVLGGGPTPQLTAAGLSPVEFFPLPAGDGTPLEAMMLRPPNFDPRKKYPAIVFLYGGPHAQLVVNAWGGSQFLFNELLAQNGYIILTVDNRGSFGRGHAFETPLYHHFGGVELEDQLAGVAWLKSQAYVDPSRIGVRGWSYGGFMTCMAMFRAADVFKAGFAGAPVTDWRQYDTIYTERYMGTPQENPEGYKNSSPVNFTGQLKGKLLIAAGTGDDNVHFANTVELAENLIQAGRYAEIQIYPGRGHGITDQAAQLHLFRRALEFFLNNL